MGVTGLCLCLFLVVHLAGNLLLLKQDGGVAFNQYAEFMASSGIIRILEVGLFLFFAIHIFEGLVLAIQNRSKRPERYWINSASENSSWTSRYMPLTGIVILLFLILHLYSFTFKHRILGVEEPLYLSVKNAFSDPLYVAIYIVAFVFLGLHLHHGFQSAFQSLGLRHKRYTPMIQWLGWLFCVLIPLGYAVIPLYFFAQSKGILPSPPRVAVLSKKEQQIWKKKAVSLLAGKNPKARVKRVLSLEKRGNQYWILVELEQEGKIFQRKVRWSE